MYSHILIVVVFEILSMIFPSLKWPTQPQNEFVIKIPPRYFVSTVIIAIFTFLFLIDFSATNETAKQIITAFADNSISVWCLLSLLSFLVPCIRGDANGIAKIKQYIREHTLSTVIRLIVPLIITIMTIIGHAALTFELSSRIPAEKSLPS
jgi:succinate dehydrogenase hydrophobic anchor subunit